jgi:hypothetical protein
LYFVTKVVGVFVRFHCAAGGSRRTMVAGGGAGVVYADTISGLGLWARTFANYGEYSGCLVPETHL